MTSMAPERKTDEEVISPLELLREVDESGPVVPEALLKKIREKKHLGSQAVDESFRRVLSELLWSRFLVFDQEAKLRRLRSDNPA